MLQIFSQDISSSFRTLTETFFLGVCPNKARNSRQQACSIREEMISQRFLEFSKFQNILSLLSFSRKVSVMEFLVQQSPVACSSTISFNWNCICFPGYIPKILVVVFQNIVRTVVLCFKHKVTQSEVSSKFWRCYYPHKKPMVDSSSCSNLLVATYNISRSRLVHRRCLPI